MFLVDLHKLLRRKTPKFIAIVCLVFVDGLVIYSIQWEKKN